MTSLSFLEGPSEDGLSSPDCDQLYSPSMECPNELIKPHISSSGGELAKDYLPVMALSQSSLSSIPTCYATVSIGTPDTPLEHKLEAIAGAGFQGIEIGFPDLLSFASKRQNRKVQPQDFETLCDAGREVKQLVDRHGLEIVMLQPFSNFEGWEEGSEGREDAFRRAKGWIKIMEAIGTDMLQVYYPKSARLLRETFQAKRSLLGRLY